VTAQVTAFEQYANQIQYETEAVRAKIGEMGIGKMTQALAKNGMDVSYGWVQSVRYNKIKKPDTAKIHFIFITYCQK